MAGAPRAARAWPGGGGGGGAGTGEGRWTRGAPVRGAPRRPAPLPARRRQRPGPSRFQCMVFYRRVGRGCVATTYGARGAIIFGVCAQALGAPRAVKSGGAGTRTAAAAGGSTRGPAGAPCCRATPPLPLHDAQGAQGIMAPPPPPLGAAPAASWRVQLSSPRVRRALTAPGAPRRPRAAAQGGAGRPRTGAGRVHRLSPMPGPPAPAPPGHALAARGAPAIDQSGHRAAHSAGRPTPAPHPQPPLGAGPRACRRSPRRPGAPGPLAPHQSACRHPPGPSDPAPARSRRPVLRHRLSPCQELHRAGRTRVIGSRGLPGGDPSLPLLLAALGGSQLLAPGSPALPGLRGPRTRAGGAVRGRGPAGEQGGCPGPRGPWQLRGAWALLHGGGAPAPRPGRAERARAAPRMDAFGEARRRRGASSGQRARLRPGAAGRAPAPPRS
jgi:hypothetical protein